MLSHSQTIGVLVRNQSNTNIGGTEKYRNIYKEKGVFLKEPYIGEEKIGDKNEKRKKS